MTGAYPKVGVGVIVIKEVDGKQYVMLHQRKGEHAEGYWGSGGGHLEVGESLKQGALRELSEEAGPAVIVDDVRFLGVMNFTEMQPKHYVDISFAARWVSGEPTNNAPEETTDWQWFPLEALPSPLFPPVKTYLEALKTGDNFFDSSFVPGE
ncbi:MAG TPA: NUDIX domain-containing protein [Candidatus Saccharimonadales bacterium]|nr:NUDIX domain-containing protein [Candidatus Saccharimonadales bacterium]